MVSVVLNPAHLFKRWHSVYAVLTEM